ncbi:MAG: hypothetical protein ABI460_11300 [Caldimonas sp.]
MCSDFDDSSDRDSEADGAPAVFRDFALACRGERDRRAMAALAAGDLRFETSTVARDSVDLLAARVIAAAAQRQGWT